jgi:hypothetical protein
MRTVIRVPVGIVAADANPASATIKAKLLSDFPSI